MIRRVALFVVAVSLLCTICSFSYAAEPIKLKFANFFPPMHKNAILF